jgi:aspartyl-tRNA(Asn)/glutamyl-tRNA(Gln) amidotransferase subunit C
MCPAAAQYGREGHPIAPYSVPHRLRFLASAGKETGNPMTLDISPMQVDEKTVRRIARLARIKVTDAEAKSLQGELSGILDWVKMLDEVDTKGIEPLTSVVAMQLRLRDDNVTDGEKAAEVTLNAPMTEDSFYVVPKVVE